MRKRMAPTYEERKAEVKEKYRKYRDLDYDSLRPDKKKLDIQISAKEEKECSEIIIKQMKKTFGSQGGVFIIKRREI